MDIYVMRYTFLKMAAKLISSFVIILIATPAVAGVRDTSKVDTIVLTPDKIQSIELICNTTKIQPKTEVINSQSEFNRFIGNACHPLPDIDFAKQTLLYFPTKTAGCNAEYIRTVKMAGTLVIYQVNVFLHDGCTMLYFNNNCIVIPKIDSRCTVRFKKTETTKHDAR